MSLVPVKIHYQLNRDFTPLERAILYLVQAGCTGLPELSDLLYIFSEDVIAEAIEKLSRAQVVVVHVRSGTIALSPQVRHLDMLGSAESDIGVLYPESFLDDAGCCLVRRRDVIGAILGEIDDSQDLKVLTNAIELFVVQEEQ